VFRYKDTAPGGKEYVVKRAAAAGTTSGLGPAQNYFNATDTNSYAKLTGKTTIPPLSSAGMEVQISTYSGTPTLGDGAFVANTVSGLTVTSSGTPTTPCTSYKGLNFETTTQQGKPGEKVVVAATDTMTLKATLFNQTGGTACKYSVRIGFYYINKAGETKPVDDNTAKFHGQLFEGSSTTTSVTATKKVTFADLGLKPEDAPIKFYAEAWDANANKSIFVSSTIEVKQSTAGATPSGNPGTTPPSNTPPGTTPPGNTPPSNTPPVDTASDCGDTFCNPIEANSLPEFLLKVMRILLTLIGMGSGITVVYGGFTMAFSQGNPDAVKRGRLTVFWAIIGLIVALLAFSIVSIVQNLIGTT
jgi:hypothetical protein